MLNGAPYLSGASERFKSATGTVERIDHGYKGRCTPVMSFTANGRNYETRTNATTSYCSYTAGQKMTVRYDPRDIKGTATTLSEDTSLDKAWTALVIGLAITGTGLFLFRKSARPKVTRQADGTLITTL
jgi:hypothetical protein